jgi:hypothetical protein
VAAAGRSHKGGNSRHSKGVSKQAPTVVLGARREAGLVSLLGDASG